VNVLFVCVANSGRSVMAERLFAAAAAGRHAARSAGTSPGDAPHPAVLEVLQELGIDASDHVPRRLDAGLLAWADLAVSTCSEEVCPVTPGLKRVRWAFDDPKDLALDDVRRVRDEIALSVERLLTELERGEAVAIEEGAEITPAEYRRMRAAVGWRDPAPDDEALTAALARTWNVVARRAGELVGIARVLDDGAMYASLWDMIVVPSAQRQGVGDALLRAVLARTEGRSIVALVATPFGRPLYERHGFVAESGGSVGMQRRA
jgi:protein-tyrosine-phosphatase